MGSAHIAVTCVVIHSVIRLFCQNVSGYIAGSVHIPVRYVKSLSFTGRILWYISVCTVGSARMPVICVLSHLAISAIWRDIDWYATARACIIVMFVIVCPGTGVFWRNIRALIVQTGHLPVTSVINHSTYKVVCTDIVYILGNGLMTVTFVISRSTNPNRHVAFPSYGDSYGVDACFPELDIGCGRYSVFAVCLQQTCLCPVCTTTWKGIIFVGKFMLLVKGQRAELPPLFKTVFTLVHLQSRVIYTFHRQKCIYPHSCVSSTSYPNNNGRYTGHNLLAVCFFSAAGKSSACCHVQHTA